MRVCRWSHSREQAPSNKQVSQIGALPQPLKTALPRTIRCHVYRVAHYYNFTSISLSLPLTLSLTVCILALKLRRTGCWLLVLALALLALEFSCEKNMAVAASVQVEWRACDARATSVAVKGTLVTTSAVIRWIFAINMSLE